VITTLPQRMLDVGEPPCTRFPCQNRDRFALPSSTITAEVPEQAHRTAHLPLKAREEYATGEI
jgi:hypothetical protein